MLEGPEILFVGLSKTPQTWYRCALPATVLDADWVGMEQAPNGHVYAPPRGFVNTGQVRHNTAAPDWRDYKVIILQQPEGADWLKFIRHLQGQGKKVLYEIDDYLHGVRKQAGHVNRGAFSKKRLRSFELCMGVCDGMICSTHWLGRRYRKFNRHVYVCENGLDARRYELTRPERETVWIGWAGASGHDKAMIPWLNAVLPVMREREDTGFVSVGHPGYAEPFIQGFGSGRAIGTPFTKIESYPAAMTLMDIALAPAGESEWYRAKSDLRWLEASALGIPVIADPRVYPYIEHGVTGYHAATPVEATELLRRLVTSPVTREQVGAAAAEHVRANRDVTVMAGNWLEVCQAVVGGYESSALVPR